MESKGFKCKTHPKETIQRLTINNDGKSPLFCLECVINRQQVGSQPLPKLHSFEEYFEEIKYRMTEHELAVRKDNVAPKETKAFLSKEDELISTFSAHIDKEKEKVKNYFAYMWTEISDLLLKKKEALIKKLDRDLLLYKENFKTLKYQVDLIYKKEIPNMFPTRDQLMQTANNLSDTNELEKYITKLNKESITYLEKKDAPEDFFRSLSKKKITKCTQEFQTIVSEQLPTFEVQPLNQFLLDFHRMIRDLGIRNNVEPANFFGPMQTGLEITESEQKMLSDWIDGSSKVGYSLRYRATRDGFQSQDFHDKCDGVAPTVTIVRTSNGEIFGGYTDVYWDPTDLSKTEEIEDDKFKRTFLFSFKRGQKFERVSKGLISIVRDLSLGPTFGAGDLSLGSKGELKEGVCQLGNAFESGGDKSNVCLAGEKTFKIQEVEVFAVKTYKQSPGKPSDGNKAVDSPLKKALAKAKNDDNLKKVDEKSEILQEQLGMFKNQISKDLALAVNNISKLEKQNQGNQVLQQKIADKLQPPKKSGK